MDPIFQTLLFSTTKGKGDTNDNTETLTTSIPRPSRYAQLRPQEALQLDANQTHGNHKHGKHKSEQSEVSNKNDAFDGLKEPSGGDSIDVYRINNFGALELVPHEDYDVVYYDEGDITDHITDGHAHDKKRNDETIEQYEKSMDLDTEEHQIEKDSTEEPVLYIVHNDPQNSIQHSQTHQDDTSYTSDSTASDFHIQSSYNTYNPLGSKISAETSLARTLTRALVQRTEGYESIRRNFGLDEEEMEAQMKRKRKVKKKDTATGSIPTASSAGSKGLVGEDQDGDDKVKVYSKDYKLLSNSLSSSANVIDGDNQETLMKLSKMNKWQEEHIPPEMQGVNIENWEDYVNWEGGISSDEDDHAKGPESQSPKQPYNPETSDCTPDFRPAGSIGGHLKRPKRITQHELCSIDPIQILYEPRNPRLDALDLCSTVDWEGAYSDSDEEHKRPNVPLLLQSSVAGKSIASLVAPLPSSRPLPFETHPNYQQRYDHELSSEMTVAELQSNIPGGSEALERYKEMRQRKREQMARDKQSRVTEVMSALSLTGTGRRITSSLMGPGGAERTGRPSRHAMGSSSTHDAEYVEQLELVYNHNIARPELTLSEYRQFHRPRLPLGVVTPACTWQLETRVITQTKSSRGNIIAADGSTMIGSYHSMVLAGSKAQAKIKNEADLSPSIGDLVIMEYSEERPPLLMTKGMTCRIVNYYRGDRARCPISAGGGDRPLRKRHGDKAAVAKGPGSTGPSGRIERPPRLIGPNQYTLKSAVDLIGIVSASEKKKNREAAVLQAKKAKEKAVDVMPEGVTEILHPKVHGPFIGEVEEGNTITGLISNLFAASLFRHESEPTDFLMVLGKISTKEFLLGESNETSKELGVVLRPFPSNIYCVGQTEPRVKVFAPGTNEEKKFMNAFIGYHFAKRIEYSEHDSGVGLSFDDMKHVFSQSKIPATQLRIRLKQVANYDRSDEGIWRLKRIGQDGFPGVDALGRKVSPEGIAAYESELAAIQRLRDLGIKDLYLGTNNLANIGSVMMYLNGYVQSALERKIKIKKILDIKRRQKSPVLPYYEKAYNKLDYQHKEAKKHQEIAKFIYQELQLAPWNISGDFIDVHKRCQGTAMMKLTGIGDPSGVGEAFSLLREDERKSNKLLTQNDGALNAQIKKITGTENDLRKLTMKQMASLLRSYGMKDKQISALKRWDRVHVIRDLSTKAASDGMGDEMERFARGEKIRLSDQRENYKKRVQEIWRRQIAALSSTDAATDVSRVSYSASGVLKEGNEIDAEIDTGKEKTADSEESDDDDDDDFAAMMEMEMTSTSEANKLVAAQLGESSMRRMGGSLDTQELSKEARELAALQRQREEERAMQSGLDRNHPVTSDRKSKKYQKVIRRKVVKTHLDGSQTVTFEFIVDKAKVEELMKIKSGLEITNSSKKKTKLDTNDEDDDRDGVCVGHAFWEDETKLNKKLGIKLKKEIRSMKQKGGRKKAVPHKVSSLTKHSHTEKQAQRKLKRQKLQEEKELYKTHHRTKGTSNRKERGAARDRMPHVILSDRLEQVRALVESRPNAGAFHKPVPRDIYPSYYELIHEPIDLQTIREKNRKYDYKKASSFLNDFELMKRNAVNFNGKESALAAEAIEIYEFVKTTIEQNREEFDDLEEAVEDQTNGKKKKKKNKTKSSDGAPLMNTANILVDGVETQVNLGTNLAFEFGEDDSDDDD